MLDALQAQNVAEEPARLGSAVLPVTCRSRAGHEVLFEVHPRRQQRRASMNVNILERLTGFGNPQLIAGELEFSLPRQRVGGRQAANRTQGRRALLRTGPNLKLPPLPQSRRPTARQPRRFLGTVNEIHGGKRRRRLCPSAQHPEAQPRARRRGGSRSPHAQRQEKTDQRIHGLPEFHPPDLPSFNRRCQRIVVRFAACFSHTGRSVRRAYLPETGHCH